MDRRVWLVPALLAATTSASLAQTRAYNLVMKDVASAYGALQKGASDLASAAEQARRLERLFKETEDFWTTFKTRDAIEAAAGARELSASIAAAAGAKDAQKVKAGAAGLAKFCVACHDSHRVLMPDKSYRIRP